MSLISNFYSSLAFGVLTEGAMFAPSYGIGIFAFPYIFSEFIPINIPDEKNLLLSINPMDKSEETTLLIETFNEHYIKETKKLRRESILWGQPSVFGALFIGGFFIGILTGF